MKYACQIILKKVGGGYPGNMQCNKVIPHAKWHAQSAASLSDMTRLVDFILFLEKKHNGLRGIDKQNV